MFSSLRMPLSLSLAALSLSACQSTSDLGLESRSFTIQQTSLPLDSNEVSADEVTRMVRRSGPSYVTLIVSQPPAPDTLSKDNTKGTPVTAGSGFVVDSSGVVMTAAHVARRLGNRVSATAADGKVYSGDVVAMIPDNDTALVRLRGFSGPAVSPADDKCLSTGELVYSLGRPHAQGNTVRLGEFETASSAHAGHYPGADGKFGYANAMVLRLSTQKGESGGPLFNEKGNLVGMVVSTLYGNGQALNLAHAVPSRTLAGFLCSSTQCSSQWRAIAAGQGGCQS